MKSAFPESPKRRKKKKEKEKSGLSFFKDFEHITLNNSLTETSSVKANEVSGLCAPCRWWSDTTNMFKCHTQICSSFLWWDAIRGTDDSSSHHNNVDFLSPRTIVSFSSLKHIKILIGLFSTTMSNYSFLQSVVEDKDMWGWRRRVELPWSFLILEKACEERKCINPQMRSVC